VGTDRFLVTFYDRIRAKRSGIFRLVLGHRTARKSVYGVGGIGNKISGPSDSSPMDLKSPTFDENKRVGLGTCYVATITKQATGIPRLHLPVYTSSGLQMF
jgi:hypothetical protein